MQMFDCRIHHPGPVDENNSRIVTWRFDTLKPVSFSLSLGGFDSFDSSCHHLYRPFQYFRWYPSASFRNVSHSQVPTAPSTFRPSKEGLDYEGVAAAAPVFWS